MSKSARFLSLLKAAVPRQFQSEVSKLLNELVLIDDLPDYVSDQTSSFTITRTRATYFCNASAGSITATLPSASLHSGDRITVVKTDSSANTVTLSADSINGSTSKSISTQYGSLSVRSDGSAWVTV